MEHPETLTAAPKNVLRATADICDEHPSARIVQLGLRNYGGSRRCLGPVQTLGIRDDNSAVKAELAQQGCGRILTIDNRGSTNCAMLGGNLARLAAGNGWAGIVVNGAIRDVDEIAQTPIAVFALASCPVRTAGRGSGTSGMPVRIGGVLIRPGDVLVGDADGVVVLPVWAANFQDWRSQ